MQSVVDFNDKHAWDDSFLVNSWDEALAEYNVSRATLYTATQTDRRVEVSQHCQVWQAAGGCLDRRRTERIARVSYSSGCPRITDLRRDHGNLIGERAAETTSGAVEPHESLDATDRESPRDKMDGVTEVAQQVAQQAAQPQVLFDVRHGSRKLVTDGRQEAKEAGRAQDQAAERVAGQSAPLAGSLPQALLGTGTSPA